MNNGCMIDCIEVTSELAWSLGAVFCSACWLLENEYSGSGLLFWNLSMGNAVEATVYNYLMLILNKLAWNYVYMQMIGDSHLNRSIGIASYQPFTQHETTNKLNQLKATS